jgi:hypothetical protein
VQCEAQIEKLANMALPSLGRFAARSQSCMASFQAKCVGPAGPVQMQRLNHAMEREKARFQREYNDRLYSGLVVLTLTMAVLCRFILKRMVLEFVCWASFLFLEVQLPVFHQLTCQQVSAAAIRLCMLRHEHAHTWWHQLAGLEHMDCCCPCTDHQS